MRYIILIEGVHCTLYKDMEAGRSKTKSELEGDPGQSIPMFISSHTRNGHSTFIAKQQSAANKHDNMVASLLGMSKPGDVMVGLVKVLVMRTKKMLVYFWRGYILRRQGLCIVSKGLIQKYQIKLILTWFVAATVLSMIHANSLKSRGSWAP